MGSTASLGTHHGEPAQRGLSVSGAAFSPRPLGASGIPASPVAFGAWGIGGGWGAPVPSPQAHRTIERALELGVTFFDTAPTYGDGESERLLGDVLGAHRDAVCIATKCGPRDDPAASLERSLDRLRTDRVELLLLHEIPTGDGALERQLEAMLALVRRGVVRAIGICNATDVELRRALDVAPIASCQEQFNLLDRDAERAILPLAREHDVGFLAYRPLASGLLTGKFRAPPRFPPDDHRGRIYWFAGREFERRRRAVERLQALADDRALTLPQLALAWVLARPGVTAVLAGARTPEQVEENAAAGAHALDAAAVEAIDDIVASIYAPRALRAGTSVASEPNEHGEFTVTCPRAGSAPAMCVGAREAYVMRHLDGKTSYADIAGAWRPGDGRRLLTAQVILLADQLGELGLLEDAHD